MAVRREVTCVNKSDRKNAHDRITHIGGANWKLTQEEAISGIKSGRWSFFVKKGGSEVDVIVATAASGHQYLKTKPDGEQPNNLLNLPECR